LTAFMNDYSGLSLEDEIYLREYDIECNKLYTMYLLEQCSDQDYVEKARSVFEADEDGDKPKSKIGSFIAGICKKIKQIFQDLGEMIANMFKKPMDAKDFQGSDMQKNMLAEAEAKRLKEIEDEIMQGRKIVNAIGNVTEGFGIDKKTVANFIDSAANKARNSSGAKIAGAALGYMAYKKIFDQITGAGKAAAEDAERVADKIAGNQEATNQLGQVVNKIRALGAEAYKIGAKGARKASKAIGMGQAVAGAMN